MNTFLTLTKRNVKLFFKDKGMFFVSMITPVILLVLYATFLANVYKNSFTESIPSFFEVSESLIDGTVSGQLLSSLMAVVPVTVAFNSNMRMVQDKMSGVYKDLLVTPVKKAVLALSYFVGTLCVTLLLCYVACGFGLGYVALRGWYMSVSDVLLLLLDVFILSLFGTALSSVIGAFLKTQGQMSGVSAIVSAGYGFICGAYMPIAQFGSVVQKIVGCLPGTYGTSLIRNHAMNGVFREMEASGFPSEVVQGIRDGVDCNLYFFGNEVEIQMMYLITVGFTLLLIAVYVLINLLRRKRT